MISFVFCLNEIFIISGFLPYIVDVLNGTFHGTWAGHIFICVSAQINSISMPFLFDNEFEIESRYHRKFIYVLLL